MTRRPACGAVMLSGDASSLVSPIASRDLRVRSTPATAI